MLATGFAGEAAGSGSNSIARTWLGAKASNCLIVNDLCPSFEEKKMGVKLRLIYDSCKINGIEWIFPRSDDITSFVGSYIIVFRCS